MNDTQISLIAPDIAEPGQIIVIAVTIENTTSIPEPHTLNEVIPVLRINSDVLSGDSVTLTPEGIEKIHTWNFEHTMPARSIVIAAESWCESYYVEWHLDSTAQKTVYLPGEAPPAGGGLPWGLIAVVSVATLGIVVAGRRSKRK